MHKLSVLLILFTCHVLFAQFPAQPDWLVQDVNKPVKVTEKNSGKDLVLSNGLIERVFRVVPNMTTTSLRYINGGDEFIRGVKPEAIITINSIEYKIGGLNGQPDYGYLNPDWLNQMTSDSLSFVYSSYSIEEIKPRFPWKRKRYSQDMPWPPKGLELVIQFDPPKQLKERYKDLSVSIHYEMYENIPVLCKWLTIHNGSDDNMIVNSVTTEVLAITERRSEVSLIRSTKPRKFPNDIDPNDWARISRHSLHVESDYAFCGGTADAADQTTFWVPDEQYETQIHYDRTWPHLLTCHYPYGPDIELKSGEDFESFHNYILLFDSEDFERRGLALRRMYRTLTPWTTENPILMHLRYSDSKLIRNAVDQCVEVGFEMIVLSFGSGFNMESEDSEYLAKVKADFDYAHSKGIEIGGYSLLASRSVGPEYDVIDPKTNKPGAYFGNSPCLVSQWGEDYFNKLKNFIKATGTDILEHDGSYPGDVCASIHHKGHQGLQDSQYAQFKKIQEFYHWCRENGVYLNVPDWYFFNGSNKSAMGYRETNWSLPRELQLIHGRQNIYDGTFGKTPSMGWMFVPLVEYQGGGAAATLEPLNEHLDAYNAHLAYNFGSGVQACYRGPRLYDTEETKAVVKKWVDFYKKYRLILDSDIIHIRRPDGRDIDAILHVNPRLEEKGLIMIYNPLNQRVEKELTVPLYYTGLTDKARIREQGGTWKKYDLDRHYNVKIPFGMEPNSVTWFVIK